MIRLRHEGIEEELRARGFANLRELIDQWGSEPDACDRLVVGVRVGDRTLDEEELQSLENVPLDGPCPIEIESRSRRRLALESLTDCTEHSVEIRSAIAEAVDQLRSGRVLEANERLANLAESFGVLVEALAIIATALGQNDSELFGLSDQLLPWLRELIEAQEVGDWVRVADCLEFEIAPLLESWRARVGSGARCIGLGRDADRARGGSDARA